MDMKTGSRKFHKCFLHTSLIDKLLWPRDTKYLDAI